VFRLVAISAHAEVLGAFSTVPSELAWHTTVANTEDPTWHNPNMAFTVATCAEHPPPRASPT
jgi:hypothetical protein